MCEPATGFEPASVRTLLHMRSSMPLRPATALTRGSRPRTGAPRQNDWVDEAPRPLSAPPSVPRSVDERAAALREREGAVFGTAAGGDEVEGDSDDDATADPGAVLTAASSEIYSLQHRWPEERRVELEALWRQLEAEYNLELPLDIAKINNDEEAGDGLATSDEAEELSRNLAEAETDAHAEVATQQLAAAREMRSRVEAALGQTRQLATDERLSAMRASAQKEEERLAELRQEVDMMRLRTADVSAGSRRPLVSVPEEDSPPDRQPLSSVGVAPSSEVASLGSWIEGMRMLRTDELDDSSPVVGCTNNAMLDPSAVAGGIISGSPPAGAQAPSDSVSAMESQLDAILAEFDSIDRIHEDMCRLTEH